MLEVPYWGWIILVIGGVVCVAIGIAAGLATIWKAREKRDGLR